MIVPMPQCPGCGSPIKGSRGPTARRRRWRSRPDATPVACRSFEDVFQAVSDGSVGARHRADGEHHRRQHPPQLRPAGRARAADRRRGTAEGRPLPARAARACGSRTSRVVHSHPQALAQCERFLQGLPNGRDRRGLRHRRRRQADSRAGAEARRGDRVDPRRARLRPQRAAARHPGFRHQHHALLRRSRATRSPKGPTRRRSCSRCRASRARSSAP